MGISVVLSFIVSLISALVGVSVVGVVRPLLVVDLDSSLAFRIAAETAGSRGMLRLFLFDRMARM